MEFYSTLTLEICKDQPVQ